MSRPGRLPVESTSEQRIVLHVDMDCFYAACERLREPPLRGEPVVVGMGYEPGETVGAVATASYEAREHGVESAQSIERALELLPRREADPDAEPTAYYRPVDMSYYEDVSEEVQSVLAEHADVLRAVSIDEAYLDVTDRTDWESVEQFAGELKTEIADTVGVEASVGVAPTMSAAKIASDHDKPDGLTVVEPGSVQSFLAPLDVEDIHEVGPKTVTELAEMGIETAGELADADPAALVDRFGERGRAIYRYARGEDDRDVTPVGKPKSLSRESSLPAEAGGSRTVREQVRTLADAVADRANRRDALYQTIGIKVVTPPFDINTRERSLSGPVDRPELVRSVALDLLAEFADREVRKVGVFVSGLSFSAGDQASLAEWDGDSDGTEIETHTNETDTTPQSSSGSRRLSGQTTLADFR
ncbi:DNA polymerase IV [Halorhabdus sp. BNX81]|uniref:DNA polymerase IV n=1 Tax=Halorhabdus sp. BNX81 TaxID=2980181 RepID=UPI0023DD3991|nr:DNA polymerase IV [Halorhabdus sp. BNX81]WEL21845.1 DNA polymerase IV [Halorhabdus sp. BNX81]